MGDQFEQVTVNLTNNKVQFVGISPSNPDRPIVFDYKASNRRWTRLQWSRITAYELCRLQWDGHCVFAEKDGKRHFWNESKCKRPKT